jgi:hypothetical protein
LAGDPQQRQEFLRVLAEDGIYLLTSVPRGGSREVQFFDYAEGDTAVFPLFSSEEKAARFARGLPLQGMTSLQCLGMNASFLLGNEWGSMRLVLNPKQEGETILTAEDLEQLRTLGPA